MLTLKPTRINISITWNISILNTSSLNGWCGKTLFTQNNRWWSNGMHVLVCNGYDNCAPTGCDWQSLGFFSFHFYFNGIDIFSKKSFLRHISLIIILRCVVCIHLITLAGKCCIDRIAFACDWCNTLNIISQHVYTM